MASSSNQVPKNPKPTVDDDDDLDDLDDVLTQFKVPQKPAPVPPSVPSSSSAAPSSGSAQSKQPAPSIPQEISDEFEAGLEELLRQLALGQSSTSPSTSNVDTAKLETHKEDEETREFRKAWEQMMADGLSGVDDGKVANEEYDKMVEKAMEGIFEAQHRLAAKREDETSKAGTSQAAASGDAYQDAIKKTMEKLKSSDESNKQAATPNPDDAFAALLEQFGDVEGTGGMDNMIEDMLGALMSKEILYEPLKELRDQFPDYLKTHTDLPPDDKKRYETQQRLATEIVAIFEKPGYSDDDATLSGEVLRLMTDMQTQGSPPSEIMGSLPEGMGLEALAKGEGCIIS